MGKAETRRSTDKRHYLLMVYVGIAVIMIFMTLVLALSSDDQASVQSNQRATSTRSPIILTAQADYATVAPTSTRSGS